MPLTVSVIVTTSPGRESNLAGCLELLGRQTLRPHQIIIVDDGSAEGEKVAFEFKKLPLTYLWRPNDCRVALSRNTGAARAQGDLLIFLDSDILLNPHGLAAYAEYLTDFPTHALYGYFGYAENYLAESCLLPPRTVHWFDPRFDKYDPSGLVPASNMIRYPHEWAWSGNFALRRQLFEATGGFDPRYRGWGGEDLDFASRLLAHGQIHFFLDAWGEQQPHNRQEAFHTLAAEAKEIRYQSHYDQPGYTPRVIYSPEGWSRLRAAIGWYLSK